MANLTLNIPDDDLKRARIQALKDGTTVNELVRVYLRNYGKRPEEVREAVEDLIRLAKKSRWSSGGRKWKREDLYDRKVMRDG